jgi:hypothetical protein
MEEIVAPFARNERFAQMAVPVPLAVGVALPGLVVQLVITLLVIAAFVAGEWLLLAVVMD